MYASRVWIVSLLFTLSLCLNAEAKKVQAETAPDAPDISKSSSSPQSSKKSKKSKASKSSKATKNVSGNPELATGEWIVIGKKSGLAVSLPLPMTRNEETSGQHSTVTHISSTDGGATVLAIQCTKYSTQYLRTRSRTQLLHEAMHRCVNALLGKVTSRRWVNFDGNEGIEFDFDAFPRAQSHTLQTATRTSHGHGLIVWANNTEYALTSDTTKADATTDKFFKSFKLLP